MQQLSGKRTEIRRTLEELAEPEYREFASSLLPRTDHNILGVRLPALRKYAGKLAKEDFEGNLLACGEDSFEEVMLQGLLIGYAHTCADVPLSEILGHISAFLPKIDNWSVCDSFCITLKIAEKYPLQMWDYILPHLRSEREFTVRFALVMLLDFYVTEEWIDRLFPLFDEVAHPGYYAKMALAWAVSICYVKFPQKTEKYLSDCRLDDFTYNKSLQKITESRCVDRETKKRIRGMRRRAETLGRQ